MIKFKLLSGIFIIALFCFFKQDDWKRYSYDNNNVSVEFPSEPQRSMFDQNSYFSEINKKEITLSIEIIDSSKFINSMDSLKKNPLLFFLNYSLNQVKNSKLKNKILYSKEIAYQDSIECKEYAWCYKSDVTYHRIFFRNFKFYDIGLGGKKCNNRENETTKNFFFESLLFLK